MLMDGRMEAIAVFALLILISLPDIMKTYQIFVTKQKVSIYPPLRVSWPGCTVLSVRFCLNVFLL